MVKGTKAGTDLAGILKKHLPGLSLNNSELKKAMPALAKDEKSVQAVAAAIKAVSTSHKLYQGDARFINYIPDESIHLVVTSPPYWTLKKYPDNTGQLGDIEEYESFLDELDAVWRHCFRLLVPGGRLVVVVGDVCLSRKKHGRHSVVPLHASIQERCRKIGFDNLAPIIWYKIANAAFEVENGSGFLGKPYEPNAIIKNDIEYILMQRKPGGYRSPTPAMRGLSVIPEKEHRNWFQQVWKLPGASTRNHPAPFPVKLAERLVRMFSFVSDTVLDPFMGTGTTSLAAGLWGRNSIGIEIDPGYLKQAMSRLQTETSDLFSNVPIQWTTDT
jgi:DNA modification methylase